MLASFGRFSSVDNDAGCLELSGSNKFPAAGDIASGDRLGHQLFILGVGGDLLLGL
ncbi:MAG: hypothetical protein QM756_30700 [Polyangiaceae bacterium]